MNKIVSSELERQAAAIHNAVAQWLEGTASAEAIFAAAARQPAVQARVIARHQAAKAEHER